MSVLGTGRTRQFLFTQQGAILSSDAVRDPCRALETVLYRSRYSTLTKALLLRPTSLTLSDAHPELIPMNSISSRQRTGLTTSKPSNSKNCSARPSKPTIQTLRRPLRDNANSSFYYSRRCRSIPFPGRLSMPNRVAIQNWRGL